MRANGRALALNDLPSIAHAVSAGRKSSEMPEKLVGEGDDGGKRGSSLTHVESGTIGAFIGLVIGWLTMACMYPLVSKFFCGRGKGYATVGEKLPNEREDSASAGAMDEPKEEAMTGGDV